MSVLKKLEGRDASKSVRISLTLQFTLFCCKFVLAVIYALLGQMLDWEYLFNKKMTFCTPGVLGVGGGVFGIIFVIEV